ncbi:hypothetical protein [Bacteroides neonati]|uniref:hypothetical protein n=1 Tax=Bacteroides neonati TaxID=1347393 RepID=UPI001CA330EF|nr:hypothetical protein [Bacteroides neonati]
MERYATTIYEESGITNSPNLWVVEHINPRYILGLLFNVIRLSIDSVEIINNLPKITF